MMKLPFVSRFAYDSVTAELRARIAELTEECHKWQDLVCEQTTGHKIHHPAPPEKPREIPQAVLDGEDEVARAKRELGPKANKRTILHKLEANAAREAQLARSRVPAPQVPVPDDMQEAVQQGRAAVGITQ